MTYTTDPHWRQIQSFLPAELQLGPGTEPAEEWWSWRGHRVHLDCYRIPQAPAKLILFHGVGTNGRQMSTILGAPIARRGYEAIAVDMPGYGQTEVARGARVTYDDWVEAACDLIDVELAKDGRAIVLYGLSAGGMLAYHAAARNRRVNGVVGMTFLDQRVPEVRDATALNVVMSRLGGPMVHLLAATPLAGVRMPMWLASKMHALVNDRRALKACLRDKTSAGNWATMRFLASYMRYQPAIEPEQFDVCPILLTQPSADRWTPQPLSDLFLQRIRRVPVEVVTLPDAGHYPIEPAGLARMHEAVESFLRRVSEAKGRS